MGYFKDILVGGWSLVKGLEVTIKRLYRPVVTLQYPRHKIEMSPSYRGHIELKRFPDTGSHYCVACGTCMKVCPSGVIKLQGEKDKALDVKRVVHYYIDFSHCSLCGLCVESCPMQTLEFSTEYELADESRWDGVIDLVKYFEESAR